MIAILLMLAIAGPDRVDLLQHPERIIEGAAKVCLGGVVIGDPEGKVKDAYALRLRGWKIVTRDKKVYAFVVDGGPAIDNIGLADRLDVELALGVPDVTVRENGQLVYTYVKRRLKVVFNDRGDVFSVEIR